MKIEWIEGALDDFTRAYVECALWSSHDESTPEGGEPMDRNYGPKDIAPETLAQMAADCASFREVFGPLLAESEQDDEQSGHDFWLTC